mmetsp:Transcript_2056/g.4809  ORF Transcript_2056/g.4809 Transcript_2056/m.4809 type:complete len:174 (-) Transcript_2056:109-630(-)
MRHVVPSSLLMRRRRSMISIVLRVSRSPVGSSRSSSSGLLASALAMVTRCCSPPDNSDGKCSIRSCRPTSVRRCAALSWRALFVIFPRIVIGSSTFSNADIVASRLKVWKTKPILSRRSIERYLSLALLSILVPKSSSSPAVAWSMHPMMFRRVVLPPPEGPRSITNSPLRTG